MKKKQDSEPAGEQQLEQTSQDEKEPDESIDEGVEINRLLGEGYSVKQIVALGFNRRTAYHYARLRLQPENDPAANGQGDGLPAVQASRGKQDLIKLGARDVIPPEAVLEVLHLPRNGDAVEVWRRGVLDGVGILLLGARYAQLTAAGQADIVKNQLDIMREAKESSKDIAEAAAAQAAHMVGGQVHEMLRQSAKPESPNPFATMLSQTMQPFLAQIMSRTIGGLAGFGQQPVIPAVQQGQQPQPIPGSGQVTPPGQPGFEQATEEEIKEAFKEV